MQPWWAEETLFSKTLKNLTNPKHLNGSVQYEILNNITQDEQF